MAGRQTIDWHWSVSAGPSCVFSPGMPSLKDPLSVATFLYNMWSGRIVFLRFEAWVDLTPDKRESHSSQNQGHWRLLESQARKGNECVGNFKLILVYICQCLTSYDELLQSYKFKKMTLQKLNMYMCVHIYMHTCPSHVARRELCSYWSAVSFVCATCWSFPFPWYRAWRYPCSMGSTPVPLLTKVYILASFEGPGWYVRFGMMVWELIKNVFWLAPKLHCLLRYWAGE